jgi:glutathione S-transferase
MKLYDYVLSGNCYKVRLLMEFLGIAYDTVPVDFYPGRAHRTPEFRDINPLEQLPVLDDGGLILRDAQAVLLYLANRYDPARKWWPADDPVFVGQTAQWLAFADLITATASAARLHDMLGYKLNVEEARTGAHRAFSVLEDHLTDREFEDGHWLVGDAPTIADIACFPYTALAGDGGIDISGYPAIGRWLRRFTALPNFTGMPGVNPLR